MSNVFAPPDSAPATPILPIPPKVRAEPTVSMESGKATIRIQMPNGAFVNFPATMSPDEIDVEIRKATGMSPKDQPTFGEDVAHAVQGGLVKGFSHIPSVPGGIDELLQAGSQKVDTAVNTALGTNLSHPQRAAELLGIEKYVPTPSEWSEKIGFRDPHPAQGTIAKIIGAGAEALGGAGPGVGLANMAFRGVSDLARALAVGADTAVAGANTLIPAVGAALRAAPTAGMTSEAAGEASEGLGFGDTISGLARILGGLTGAGIVPGVKRLITPKDIPAPHVEARRILQEEGIDVTPGQGIRSNRAMRHEGGAWGGEKFDRRQAEQVTAAAMRRVGEHNTRYATQDVMDGLFTRFGNQIEGLSRRNQMHGDNQLITDAQDTWRDYNRHVRPETRHPLIERYFDDITEALQTHNGVIPGDIYQEIRSQIRADARAMFKSPSTEGYIHGTALNNLADDLDDAMERSIATFNPDDLGQWQGVRGNYRNLMVIEKALSGAGSDARLGILTPQALASATKIVQGKRGFIRGQGPFARFANAAEALVRPMPETGFTAIPSWSEKNLIGAALHPATQALRWASMRPPVSNYLNNNVIRGEGAIRGRPPLDPLAMTIAQSIIQPQSQYRTGEKF